MYSNWRKIWETSWEASRRLEFVHIPSPSLIAAREAECWLRFPRSVPALHVGTWLPQLQNPRDLIRYNRPGWHGEPITAKGKTKYCSSPLWGQQSKGDHGIINLLFFLFFFLVRALHAEVPRPGITLASQQWPKPLLWHHQILKLRGHQGIPSLSITNFLWHLFVWDLRARNTSLDEKHSNLPNIYYHLELANCLCLVTHGIVVEKLFYKWENQRSTLLWSHT